MLGRRALSAGRLAALGATPDFHHGLLDAYKRSSMQRHRPTGALAPNARSIASINSTLKLTTAPSVTRPGAHGALRAPGACGRDVDLSA